MKLWLLYGIFASLCWGSYIIISKVVTSQSYLGIDPSITSLFMLIGIAVAFLLNLVFEKTFYIPESKLAIGLGILSGAIWALGMISSLKALKSGADVARLAPIYNTNTLVSVILAIILLKELPSSGEMFKVVLGALLIVIGSILVGG